MNRTIINYLVKRAAHFIQRMPQLITPQSFRIKHKFGKWIVNKMKLANTKTNSVGTEKRTELQVNLEKKTILKIIYFLFIFTFQAIP